MKAAERLGVRAQGDKEAKPARLALRAGEEITLTSLQPGGGWWTAVRSHPEHAQLLPAAVPTCQVSLS